MEPSLFERSGGEPVLRAVLRDFFDAVFADLMIGFLFRRANKEHLIEREYQLIAEHFGAPGVTYRGRPLGQAHAPHRILGGQFERRMVLLQEAMDKHRLDPEVQRAWIAHNRALRAAITADAGTECNG